MLQNFIRQPFKWVLLRFDSFGMFYVELKCGTFKVHMNQNKMKKNISINTCSITTIKMHYLKYLESLKYRIQKT